MFPRCQFNLTSNRRRPVRGSAFGIAWLSLLRGLSNDVYFQVGLLTTIGLSAKNATLIVEFD
jgi:multidrug efflux pump subunit AcrB